MLQAQRKLYPRHSFLDSCWVHNHYWDRFVSCKLSIFFLQVRQACGPLPSSLPCTWSRKLEDVLYLFIFLIALYWSIIASQYCVSFCCTTKGISHIHTHVPISPPSWASLPSSLSHPSRSSQNIQLISLCYAAASHQPTILHSVVYICRCYSHFTPASPSHPMSSSPFSMSTSLFLPCN